MYSHALIVLVHYVKLFAMKAILLTLVLGFSTISGFAEDWVTTDGINYQDVKVIRVEDDAVTIIYKDGGALIPLFKLPHSLQERFDYDPVKAKAAAEARTKADAEKALQAEIELSDKMKRAQAIKDATASGQTNAP